MTSLTDEDRALIESVLKDDAADAISQDMFTLDEVIALLSAARSQGPGEGWEPIERVRAYIAEFKPRCYPDAGGLARRTAFQEIEDLLPPAPPASQTQEG